MEEINDVKHFSFCMESCKLISNSALLFTSEDTTKLIAFDNITAVMCSIPELEGKYNDFIDVNSLSKILKKIKKSETLYLDITEEKIAVEIKGDKSLKRYVFPHYTHESLDKGIAHKLETINYETSFSMTIDSFLNYVSSLVFKEVDKITQKVIIKKEGNNLMLHDVSGHKGKSSVLATGLMDFVKDNKVYETKFNWINVKDIIKVCSGFSDNIEIQFGTELPICFSFVHHNYRIRIITAPMIEEK